MLKSQSVLRNDVTLYCLARYVWRLFWVEFCVFLYNLGPRLIYIGFDWRQRNDVITSPDSLWRHFLGERSFIGRTTTHVWWATPCYVSRVTRVSAHIARGIRMIASFRRLQKGSHIKAVLQPQMQRNDSYTKRFKPWRYKLSLPPFWLNLSSLWPQLSPPTWSPFRRVAGCTKN